MEATLNKNENYTWKFVKKSGNIMEFCHHGKMGTLYLSGYKSRILCSSNIISGIKSSFSVFKLLYSLLCFLSSNGLIAKLGVAEQKCPYTYVILSLNIDQLIIGLS